jgi:hypothetical protein
MTNGAISWQFFKSSGSTPASGPDLVRVGDTKDSCDRSRHVRFKTASNDEFSISAGQSKLVRLKSPRNTLDWFCVPPSGNCPDGDVCDEHAGNPIAFDAVQIERAANGAISWVFYRKKNTSPADESNLPDFVRNANGNVRVAISAGAFKKEFDNIPPALLKVTLDHEWTNRHLKIRTEVRDELVKQGEDTASKMGAKFVLESLTIANTGTTELRVAAEGNTVAIKYLAHGNRAQTRFSMSGLPDPEFSLTFDIEVEARIRLDNLTKPPQAAPAVMRLGHAEIEGTNFTGNIAQEVFKTKLQNSKTKANNVTRDITDEVNKALSDNFPAAPFGSPTNVVQADISVTRAGTTKFCLRASGAAPCQFDGPSERSHVPRQLDSSIDRCSHSRIWLRDAAKQKFVSIAKGEQNVIVEVESREFPWFCGGEQGPESDESAAGPVGTYLVRVSRAASGDRIDWGFLSWR